MYERDSRLPRRNSKKYKVSIRFLMQLLVLLVLFMVGSNTVHAADSDFKRNHQDTLTLYTGRQRVVTIPSCTYVDDMVFSKYHDMREINITWMAGKLGPKVLSECDQLSAITVDENNLYYKSINGVLFSKDGKTLIRYPATKLIPSYTIPEEVTSIAADAFHGTSRLENITVSKDIKGLGAACKDLTGLKTITVSAGATQIKLIDGVLYNNDQTKLLVYPQKREGTTYVVLKSVTTISDCAFYNCDKLTQVTIPDGVKTIGTYAFSNCDKLTQVTIPDGVKTIEAYVFDNCRALTQVTIPDGVKTIEAYAFHNCDAINKLIIPDSVETIGKSAISDCKKLTEIKIPEGVTSLEESVLSFNDSLISVSLPSTLTIINNNAFEDDPSLTEIVIPKGVNHVGNKAFKGCLSLRIVTVLSRDIYEYVDECMFDNNFKGMVYVYGDSDTYRHYKDTNINLIVLAREEELEIKDGVLINDRAHYDHSLPRIVKTVNAEAFSSPYLSELYIPDSVTSIHGDAFRNSTNLSNIYVDSMNKYYQSKDYKVLSKDGTEFIVYARKEYDELEDLCYIPSGVTTIDGSAFEGCIRLVKIDIPKSVTEIGNRAFKDCKTLRDITLPEGITTIGDHTFSNCKKINELKIPEKVTSIGEEAFAGCSGLKEITIPDSVMSIADNAFSDCAKDMVIYGFTGSAADRYAKENNFKFIAMMRKGNFIVVDGELVKYTGTDKDLLIQDGITKIGEEAFKDCLTLENIELSDSVETIGKSAFAGCSNLSKVTLNKVKVIDDFAFKNCESIWEMEINTSLKTMGKGAFSGCSKIHFTGNKYWIDPTTGMLANNAILYCCPLHCTVYGYNTVPKHVRKIVAYAYDGCDDLLKITLGENVQYIEPYAFYGCPKLSSIHVDKFNKYYEAIDYILYKKGKKCLVLYPAGRYYEEFTVPSRVTEISSGAFLNCSNLKKVTINSTNITSMGEKAFENCKSLTDVVFKKDFKSITEQTFSNCNGNLNITLGDYKIKVEGNVLTRYSGSENKLACSFPIKSIGAYAFADNKSLTEITIPDYITSIESNAFNGCSALSNIMVDVSNTNFKSCDGVLYSKDGSTLISYPSAKSGKTYQIPEGVKIISDGAFSGCIQLEKISLPESVALIGENAFSGCTSLVDINIPENVSAIGKEAFMGCSLIKEIAIPENVTDIGENVFEGCTELKQITVDKKNSCFKDIDGVLYDKSEKRLLCYPGKRGAKHYVLPSTVTRIDQSVFEGLTTITYYVYCNTFTESYVKEKNMSYAIIDDNNILIEYKGLGGDITIPDKYVVGIGDRVFNNKEEITGVVLPGSLRSIGRRVFDDCINITQITVSSDNTTYKSIDGVLFSADGKTLLYYPSGKAEGTIPSGVEIIGNGAFYRTRLEDVIIPDSVNTLEDEAFYYSNMKSVEIKGDIISVGKSVFSCCSMASVKFSGRITQLGEYMFSNCHYLKEITIPDEVKDIGDHAFYGCSALDTITIPEGVTEIKNGTFIECTSLKNITIPKSVTKIDKSAFSLSSIESVTINGNILEADSVFSGCNLTSITFSEEVTSICPKLFRYCRKLKEIRIPKNITSIGKQAFDDCDLLEKVTINGNITNASDVFSNCNLTSVTFSEEATSICPGIFRNCDKLKEISIPENITSIGKQAFENCDLLENVTVKGDAIIGENVFSNCKKLKSITFLGKSTSIDARAFSGCTGLTSITLPEGLTSIGASAFSGCTGLTSITLPKSLTSIGAGAFSGCTGLTSITLPEGLTSIGASAFLGCTGLTSIPLPKGLTSIGNSTFSGCTGLTSITLPEGVTSIGASAFSGCAGLTSITLPERLTSIGASAFSGCAGLTSITLPEGLTSIGDSAFSGCAGLTSITLPEGLTSIGDSAFSGWTELTSITLPEGLTSIGASAFSGCTGLTSITLPESVVNVGDNAFNGCSAIKSVEINGNVKCGIGVFKDCIAIESITLSDDFKEISNSMFMGCKGLTSITIPQITYLQRYAFKDCTSLERAEIAAIYMGEAVFSGCTALKSVTISDEVRSMGRSVFSGCTSLENVTLSKYLKIIGKYTFEDCFALKSITIPKYVTEVEALAFWNCTALTKVTILNEKSTTIDDKAFKGSGLKIIYGYSNNKLVKRYCSYHTDIQFIPLKEIDISKIEGVTIPVSNAVPVTSINENDQYTGYVTWSPIDTKFMADTVYTATITIQPKEGYSLKAVIKDFFTVEGAESVSNYANSGVITAVFPKIESAIESITIKTAPDKIAYVEGDTLDLTGLVVILHRENGTSVEVPLNEFHKKGITTSLNSGDELHLSDRKITITYTLDHKSVEQQITVDKLAVTKLTVKEAPEKTKYIEGDKLDLIGLIVTVHRNNKTTEEVGLADFKEKGLKTTPENGTLLTVTGSAITITYTADNKSVEQKITVDKLAVTKVTVKEKPKKLAYLEGDKLDLTGLVITLYRNNKTTEDVSLVDFNKKGIEVTPENKEVLDPTNSVITITYVENNQSVEQKITVNRAAVTNMMIKTAPDKTSYVEGDKLDLTGLVVTLSKNNKTTEDVGFTDFKKEGITTTPENGAELSVSGSAITITYTADNKSVEQKITVQKVPLPESVTVTSIAVKTPPTKISYVEGEALDLSGLFILLCKSNETTEEVSYADFNKKGIITTPQNGAVLSASGSAITITYIPDHKSVSQSITVTAVPVDNHNAVISPTVMDYDLNHPADVRANIIWNSATNVTNVVRGADSLATPDAYAVSGSAITLNSNYLKTLGLVKGSSENFLIVFDKGASARLTVNIIDSSEVVPIHHRILMEDDGHGTANADALYAIAGTEITLLATPGKGYHFKEWQIIRGGITITDNRFYMPDEEVSLKAIFEEDLLNYALTVNDSYALQSGAGSYHEGTEVTINAGYRDDYIFSGWSCSDNVNLSNIYSNPVTIIMPAKDISITAIWSHISNPVIIDPVSYKGDNKEKIDETKKDDIVETDHQVSVKTTIKATIDSQGTVNAIISDNDIEDAIEKCKEEMQKDDSKETSVELNFDVPEGAKDYSASLSEKALSALADSGISKLQTSGLPVSIGIDQNALKAIRSMISGDVTIKVVPQQNIPEGNQGMIGERPAYNIEIGYVKDGNNRKVTNFNGSSINLSISYTLEENESENAIYAIYVDEEGKEYPIVNSSYNAKDKQLYFSTKHLSTYGVGYRESGKIYTDIDTHWAKDEIYSIVDRGLIAPASETEFSPEKAITRAQFITALGKLAEIDRKAYNKSSFTDVKADNEYAPYIEWAYREGIIPGVERKRFAPDQAITREEVAAVLVNYAKSTEFSLPVIYEENNYADSNKITSEGKSAITALQQAGIMLEEAGNQFNPGAAVTCAQASVILSRYIKQSLNPKTAEGWTYNDSGEYSYYENGKRLTGMQVIEAVTYCFDNKGILVTEWLKIGNNTYYYSGKHRVTGWYKIGSGKHRKTYYFNKKGVMTSKKWKKINGKWYYFYKNGSLAVDTKINGYQVDKKGVRKTKK